MGNKITISRNLKLGALDAETDYKLLDRCFVNTGVFDELLDVESPASVILGRTGAGKSALIYKLSQEVDKYAKLNPTDISIRFLEQSDIIRFFEALEINLDLFYRFLWRHILTVELLKLRYSIQSEQDGIRFFESLSFSRSAKTKRKALEYFREWHDRFWLDSEEQLVELTTKLETDTKAKLSGTVGMATLSVEGVKRLSDSQRTEVKARASQVVNGLQIRKLNEVLDLLAENAFDDPQKKFYIFIDQLDEDWASTDTRCRFIRALIEEIKTFRKLATVKIVAALRKDLLDLVLERTRDAGFQEDKHEAYFLQLNWTPSDLKELIKLRVNEVFRSQYTSGQVELEDVFSKSPKAGQNAIDYMLERTLRRPRDVLQFVNEAFKIASGRDRVSWRAIQAAESHYSTKRLSSLREEWGTMYPSFDETVELLRGMPSEFTRKLLSGDRLDDVLIALAQKNTSDPCVKIAEDFCHSRTKEFDALAGLLMCLYKVGAIGIKISTLDTFVWSYIDQSGITKSEIKRSNQIKVHKMLHRALDIAVDISRKYEVEVLD